MKILSFILSTTMLVNSIPCTSLYAQQAMPQDLCDSSSGKNCISNTPSKTPTGTDDFKSFMQEKKQHGGMFVDKSLLIKELINSTDKATLITRPRRWGKSLNLSMFKYFFMPEIAEDGFEKDSRVKENLALFSELNINKQFLDTREIVTRLLLKDFLVDSGSNIGKYKDVIQEIISLSGFEDREKVLKSFGSIRGQGVDNVLRFIEKYSEDLRTKFSGFDNLPSLLKELNQLYSQMQRAAEHQKQEGENKYNAKFEAVRQQIETYVENNTDLKAELSKEFDLMARHQGQHPTILLSFRDVKKDTYADIKTAIESEVVDLFANIRGCLKSKGYGKSIGKFFSEGAYRDGIPERLAG